MESQAGRTFQDILKNRLEVETAPAHHGVELDSALLTELLHHFKRRQRPLQNPAPPIETPLFETPTKAEKVLAPAQKLALEFFTTHGVSELNATWNSKDLKKAYRKLAKKLHPDSASPNEGQGRNVFNRLFRELHQSYKVLLPLFDET